MRIPSTQMSAAAETTSTVDHIMFDGVKMDLSYDRTIEMSPVIHKYKIEIPDNYKHMKLLEIHHDRVLDCVVCINGKSVAVIGKLDWLRCGDDIDNSNKLHCELNKGYYCVGFDFTVKTKRLTPRFVEVRDGEDEDDDEEKAATDTTLMQSTQ